MSSEVLRRVDASFYYLAFLLTLQWAIAYVTVNQRLDEVGTKLDAVSATVEELKGQGVGDG